MTKTHENIAGMKFNRFTVLAYDPRVNGDPLGNSDIGFWVSAVVSDWLTDAERKDLQHWTHLENTNDSAIENM